MTLQEFASLMRVIFIDSWRLTESNLGSIGDNQFTVSQYIKFVALLVLGGMIFKAFLNAGRSRRGTR